MLEFHILFVKIQRSKQTLHFDEKIILSEIDILLMKILYQIETLQLDEKIVILRIFSSCLFFLSVKVTNRINDTRYQARMQLFIYL